MEMAQGVALPSRAGSPQEHKTQRKAKIQRKISGAAWSADFRDVQVPSGRVALTSKLLLPSPALQAVAPGVVLLHGCLGAFQPRDLDWARRLAAAGHPVLLPDSFGSRGLRGSQCQIALDKRKVKPAGLRRDDAVAAAQWLHDYTHLPVAIMGWSNGGNTVLWTGNALKPLPRNVISRLVAFYPGCNTVLERADAKAWEPAAPLMILVGGEDDWTPAPACQELARRFPGRVTTVVYPEAFHDFDAPDMQPCDVRNVKGSGASAKCGTNPAAREDALRRVPLFLTGSSE